MAERVNGSGWDWSRITLGSAALATVGVGAWLVDQTPDGTALAGLALMVLGGVLVGAWIDGGRGDGE